MGRNKKGCFYASIFFYYSILIKSGKDSHNHPMFGGVIVWLYRKLAGMNTDPENPGYRNIIFKPQPVDKISYASYASQTPYGYASIRWDKNNGKFGMKIVVPVGSTATVYVPASDASSVTESGRTIKKSKYIILLHLENGYVVFKVPSGIYNFKSIYLGS